MDENGFVGSYRRNQLYLSNQSVLIGGTHLPLRR